MKVAVNVSPGTMQDCKTNRLQFSTFLCQCDCGKCGLFPIFPPGQVTPAPAAASHSQRLWYDAIDMMPKKGGLQNFVAACARAHKLLFRTHCAGQVYSSRFTQTYLSTSELSSSESNESTTKEHWQAQASACSHFKFSILVPPCFDRRTLRKFRFCCVCLSVFTFFCQCTDLICC